MSLPETLTQIQMDLLVAGAGHREDCKCDEFIELAFNPECHPRAAIKTFYQRGGRLMMRCGECHKILTVFLIAKTE